MNSTVNVSQARADTPVCESLIHLNNAGCSLQPLQVQSKIREYLDSEQQIGGYETASKYSAELAGFYVAASRLLNCQPDEIAYFEGSTRAWQQFFYSLDFQPGDQVITTRLDYGSNFVGYIQMMSRREIEVSFIDTDENGDLDLQSLESLITGRTKLISVSHIPTGNGIINPAEQIGAIAAQAGVPYLVDACQSAGHLDLDVRKLQCTALATAGRKYLRGPRGSGFLFVSRNYYQHATPPLLEQQGVKLIDEESYEMLDSARRFESFETSFAGKLGLSAALEYAVQTGMPAIEERIVYLGAYCRRQLRTLPGVSVYDRGTRQGGIVTFSKQGMTADEICSKLNDKGINTWVSTGPGSLIEFQSRGIEALSRASVHYYNTEQEIETFCSVLGEI